MRALLKISSFMIAVNMALACGGGSTPVSTVKHNNNEPTRGVEPWMWAAVTDAQYKSHMAPLVGVEASDILPADHALTRRVQMWIDLIDAKLRAEHGDEMARTPKPRAKVVKDGSTNAFVAPVPVCYKLNLKVRNGSANAANTADIVYLDNKNGEMSEWPTDLKCLAGTNTVATLKRFAQNFNAHSNGVCSLTVSGNADNAAKLIPSEGCARNDDIANIVAARAVAIMQTANHVTVFTGLFAAMSEPEFVAVLAHELGHYYRSHATGTESLYDFFYEIPVNGNVAARPVADESLRQLGQAAITGSTLLNATDLYRTVAAQKLRPELFSATGSVVKAVCAAGACSAPCKGAKDLMATAAFKTAMGRYPFGAASSGEAAAYNSFETKALACLETLNVGTSGEAVTADSISWDGVVALTMQPAWPEWLAALPMGTQQALSRYSSLAALRMGNSTSASDLAAAIKGASADFKSQDDEGETALRQAYSRRLGYYTYEQEADDQAAEWMAVIGFDPKSAVEAMQQLGRGDDTSLRGLQLGEADCTELFQNDWANANGAPMFVPIGDYSEVHHSSCFRMYNIDREIAAHGHVSSGATLPQHGGSAWVSLQQMAVATGSASLGGGSGVINLRPIVKKTGFARCQYAQSKFL